MRRLLTLAFLMFASFAVQAQDGDAPARMTADRLIQLLLAFDPEAFPLPHGVALTIDEIPVMVLMDVQSDRMRAMVPVASVEGLSEADLLRVMQANFDTALDARYAVANDRLWSVFVHPLSDLEREQQISGLVQTVILAQTYGATYSSGAVMFGLGDSGALHAELFEDLLQRGEEL